MTIHIFNPEHDIALAKNLERFTPPRAARWLRRDLGFLPALWAETGDLVLVDSVEDAQNALRNLGLSTKGQLVNHGQLCQWLHHTSPHNLRLEPWGWDTAIASELERLGATPSLLPSPFVLDALRNMSHRAWAAEHLLPVLRQQVPETVGQAWAVETVEEVMDLLMRHDRLVLKQPWSSSGRGVRMVERAALEQNEGLRQQIETWAARCIREQRCVMVEPYYNKVADLAMEFLADGRGNMAYQGLSLFTAEHEAYAGNVLASEEEKMERLRQIGLDVNVLPLVAETISSVMATALCGLYSGPLGVDMMVVDEGSDPRLHACVELNLRCTMGHVALALTRLCPTLPSVMRVAFSGTGYKLELG